VGGSSTGLEQRLPEEELWERRHAGSLVNNGRRRPAAAGTDGASTHAQLTGRQG
jgi:hypothetical protein